VVETARVGYVDDLTPDGVAYLGGLLDVTLHDQWQGEPWRV
jgi:hypothetical protein